MIRQIKIWPRMAVYTLVTPDYEYFVPSVLGDLPANDGIRLISINGKTERFLTEEEKDILRSKYNFTFINSYRFDDIGGEIWESIIRRKNLDPNQFLHFNEDIAKEICDSILTPYEPVAHYEESNELLAIHCHAGISRSAAIGCALAYHLNLDAGEFATMNPNIDPNPTILEIMLKQLGHSVFGFRSWRNRRNRFD